MSKLRFILWTVLVFAVGVFLGATQLDISQLFVAKVDKDFKWVYVGQIIDDQKEYVRLPLDQVDQKKKSITYWSKIVKSNVADEYMQIYSTVSCDTWTDSLLAIQYNNKKTGKSENIKPDPIPRFIYPDTNNEMRSKFVCKKAGLIKS